jgi:glutamate racemase
LVEQIEAGELDSPRTRTLLENVLRPMLQQNIDTVVLGCTHYPFVIPLIQSIVGDGVRVIDPAPAVARQVRRIIEAKGWSAPVQGTSSIPFNESNRFLTTGDPSRFQALLVRLLGLTAPVQSLLWRQGELNE